MTTNNNLANLLDQYFSFCTGLIKKIPSEGQTSEELLMTAIGYRDKLEMEIIKSEIECKNAAIKEIEYQIQRLKSNLDNKEG